MIDRMQRLSFQDLTRIHDASMNVLRHTGIDFNHERIAGLFKSRGFKTDGTRVYFEETDIYRALSTTVPSFTLHARNSARNVTIGGPDGFVFIPTGGATYIAGTDGTQRPATFDDFKACCKLVQTSDQVDMGGYLMVQPTDLPWETANLDMMLAYMTLCDKPVFGASGSGQEAADALEMAAIIFGGREKMLDMPVVAAVANTLSPLRFSKEEGDVILQMAGWRQPVVISNMILAGVSGPVSLPELLVLENAEVLAGVVLTQLVSPGAPVLYGSSSAPIDMRTMVSAVGTSEAVKIASATAQMAGFYKLPCRAGGSLTDAHLPDAQALAEGTLMLSTVVRNGAHFIYHACGQMGSYISMGYEKWLLDEEICRMVRNILTPMIPAGETIDTDLVNQVGIGGQYLTHPSTFQKFRNLSASRLFNRKDYSRWQKSGAMRVEDQAYKALGPRLENYEKPPIDPGLEHALTAYVTARKFNHQPAARFLD
jgi:trimethylamine--corrinoid protein Co-methyltransferase